mmetsp:Transcript_20834/g.37850  ORF Transcript_20834/g.37850 Transcript_20834/m.37850 type:complete len:104 (-) Transcript_20834:32-343(-)
MKRSGKKFDMQLVTLSKALLTCRGLVLSRVCIQCRPTRISSWDRRRERSESIVLPAFLDMVSKWYLPWDKSWQTGHYNKILANGIPNLFPLVDSVFEMHDRDE